MLDKCANPGCAATFLKLRDGKLFVIEVEVAYSSNGGRRARQPQHYWLCSSCRRTMTVIPENGERAKVVPLTGSATRAAS